MKKTTTLAILIAIVALGISMIMGHRVEARRAELVTRSEQLEIVYLPRLGFDKFLTDLQWVLLIQQLGGQTTPGELTPDAANYFAKTIDNLTNLDPDFAMAYKMGGETLAYSQPVKAYELLNKAMQNTTEYDWQLPFYAGFIAERLMPNAGVSPEESNALAMTAYNLACDSTGAPAYIRRTRMRFATRDAGPDKVDLLEARTEFVMENTKQQQTLPNSSMNEHSEMHTMDEFGNNEFYGDTELVAWLVKESRDLSAALVKQRDADNAEAAAPTIEARLARVHQVHDTLRKINIATDAHVCSACLTPYGAGEFFCGKCGHELEPYGYCKACWKQQQRLVLLKGEYCPICGTQETVE